MALVGNWLHARTVFRLGLLGTLCAFACSAAADAPGKISGTVEPADKKINSDTYLVWTRIDSPAKVTARRTGAQKVTAAGKFDFADLPEGKYSVCVQSPAKEFLDPCLWGTRSTFTVDAKDAAKSQHTDVKIDLQRAVLLRFIVEDPDRLLDKTSKAAGQASLGAGIWTPSGEYIPLFPVQLSPTRQLFEVAVPRNSGLHADFRRVGVGIAYLRGSKSEPEILYVDSTAGFGLMIPDKSDPQMFRFQVSAEKK